jgi:hypothetical protein
MCRNFEKDTGARNSAGASCLEMPRPPRDTRAGIFHVFTHCVWAAPALFRDDLSRTVFLRELARVTRCFEWTCVGFCLMRTHYHLMLDVPDKALPVGMQSLNFRYAIDFNQRYGMRGHVQFARYGAVRIESDSQLLTAYKYVVRTPSRQASAATARTGLGVVTRHLSASPNPIRSSIRRACSSPSIQIENRQLRGSGRS